MKWRKERSERMDGIRKADEERSRDVYPDELLFHLASIRRDVILVRNAITRLHLFSLTSPSHLSLIACRFCTLLGRLRVRFALIGVADEEFI